MKAVVKRTIWNSFKELEFLLNCFIVIFVEKCSVGCGSAMTTGLICSFFSSGIGRILHVDWQLLLLQSVQSRSGWSGASVHPIPVSPRKRAQACVWLLQPDYNSCLAGVLFCRIWPLCTSGTRTTLTGRSTSPNAGSSSTFWTACGASSKCKSQFLL